MCLEEKGETDRETDLLFLPGFCLTSVILSFSAFTKDTHFSIAIVYVQMNEFIKLYNTVLSLGKSLGS